MMRLNIMHAGIPSILQIFERRSGKISQPDKTSDESNKTIDASGQTFLLINVDQTIYLQIAVVIQFYRFDENVPHLSWDNF